MRDNKKRIRRHSGGFTVIEVLIAITLLVVALIPLASIISMSLKTSVNTKTSMHAREVASSEIDSIKGMDFEAVGISGAANTFEEASNNEQVAPDAGFSGLSAGPETVDIASGNSFTVTRDVRKIVNSSFSNSSAVKKIVIIVSWDGPGSPGSELMTTNIGSTGNAE